MIKFLPLLFLLSFFQMYVIQFFPWATYFDEVLFIWSIIILFKQWKKLLCEKRFANIIYLIMSVIAIGLLCNSYYAIQTDTTPIIIDVVSCFKVFVVYMATYVYAQQVPTYEISEGLGKIYSLIKILVLIMFPFAILNILQIVDMGRDFRHGLPSFQFIFDGAGNFSMLFYMILSIISFNYICRGGKGAWDRLIIILCLVTWLLTLRSRAFLFVTVYCLLFFYTTVIKQALKVNFFTIAIGTFLFYLICKDQAEIYMGDDSTARYNLLFGGIENFKRFFPFGSGFGTYGTDAAAKYYSPLYYEYGFQHVWGLAPNDTKFAHDNYWPAIMGQFGLIGIVLFGLIIYNCFRHAYDITKGNETILVSVFFIFTQFIASTATAVFFHYQTMWLVFFMALMLSYINRNNNEEYYQYNT